MTVSPARPTDLRSRAARGSVVNAGFTIGLQGLTLLKGFVVAAFLTRADYGIWGILVITLGTLSWLKQVGISEKFVQQNAADERLAFQRAFTLDLLSNLALLALALVLLPLFAAVYGQWEIVVPGLVLLATVPFQSLRAPTWVFYRHMRYGRQRALEATDPVVSFVVTVILAVAGLGYWALVGGFAAGVLAAGLAAVIASPHPLALRYDRSTTREYVAFSWPLFVAGASTIVIPQASMIAGEATLGLAGAGVITLASLISTYADRVDQVLTHTLYPAICRIQDQTALLFEAFLKSNRLALMWSVPFGAGVAIFAGDLVHFALGDRWEPAIGLIRAFALTSAANQLGFNWAAFFRARGNTRPLAVAGPVVLVAFLVLALPLLIAFGLTGYALGIGAMTFVALTVRTYYVKQLFPAFRMLRFTLRSILPTVPAVVIVLAARAVIETRTPALFLAELVAFVAIIATVTWHTERALIREAAGYLRRR